MTRRQKDDIRSYWMTLGNKRILEIERGSIRLPSAENSLCKQLWTRRKKDYGMNELYKGSYICEI